MVISSAGRARNADVLVKAFKMMERDPNVAAEEEIFLVALNSCSLAEVSIIITPSQPTYSLKTPVSFVFLD